MKFDKGTAVTYAGEAWTVLGSDAEVGLYHIESLDGTRVGYVEEAEVQRAP